MVFAWAGGLGLIHLQMNQNAKVAYVSFFAASSILPVTSMHCDTAAASFGGEKVER